MGLIRQAFDKLYWKLTRWIAPGLVNAQRAYLTQLTQHLRPESAWLDLGCGRRLVPSWIPDADRKQQELVSRVAVAVGMDLDHESLAQNNSDQARVLGGGSKLPFPDATFDLITANMVIEHLEDPSDTLDEIYRVLKPEGVFLFHTPNVLNPITLMTIPLPQRIKNRIIELFENRRSHDVFPTYYRFNHPQIIRWVSREVGFKVDRCDLLESSPETVMLGPLVALEMLFIRLTRWEKLSHLRSNIITALRKPRVPVTMSIPITAVTTRQMPRAPRPHRTASPSGAPGVPETPSKPFLDPVRRGADRPNKAA